MNPNGRRGTLGTLFEFTTFLTISKGRCEFLLVRFHFVVKKPDLAWLLWLADQVELEDNSSQISDSNSTMENPLALSSVPGSPVGNSLTV